MLQTQVDYWNYRETVRHNEAMEKAQMKQAKAAEMQARVAERNVEIGKRNARANLEQAAAASRQAGAAEQNASSNWLNAISNSRNASSNERNAASNEANVLVNKQNADANTRNAETNARNADINAYNAETNRINAAINQQNADTNRMNAITNREVGKSTMAYNYSGANLNTQKIEESKSQVTRNKAESFEAYTQGQLNQAKSSTEFWNRYLAGTEVMLNAKDYGWYDLEKGSNVVESWTKSAYNASGSIANLSEVFNDIVGGSGNFLRGLGNVLPKNGKSSSGINPVDIIHAGMTLAQFL